MPAVLLVMGVLAIAAKANALRPTRLPLLVIPSFFLSWAITELAGWWLAIEATAVAALAAGGAVHGATGWAGFAMMALSCAALAWIIAVSGRTSATLQAAGAPPEGTGFGGVAGDAPPLVRFPRSHVIFPFLLTHRRGVRRVKDVVYAEVAGVRLRLDIYIPNGCRGTSRSGRADGPWAGPAAGRLRPGILQLHGGDWSYGDKRAEAIPLLGHLAAAGWVAIAANYRLSPRFAFPAHLEDVKRAIAWYREHAHEYGADPEFLAITGGSAGAHLAALAALTPDDPAYQPGFESAPTGLRAAVTWYGAYDFTNRLGTWTAREMRMLEQDVMQRPLADCYAEFAAASPMDRVRADAPPFLVLHGDIDTISPVAEARAFVAKLRAVSPQRVVYAELRGAQHGFDLVPSHRCARAVEAAERFLAGVHRDYMTGREAPRSREPAG